MTTKKTQVKVETPIEAEFVVVPRSEEIQSAIDKASRAKKRSLTIREARLIRGVVAGKTKRQAARDAGYTGSNETVSVTASRVLSKANVQEALAKAMDHHGITIEKIIAPVAKALDAKVTYNLDGIQVKTDQDDLEMQLKGHDRAMKILTLNKSDDKDSGGNTIIFNQQNNLNTYMRPKDD
ncbi:MAG TPA: hypothetical protein VJ841_03515 [Candidatus Saccharimonadales bacterium]|nr:hypothetical protein [Candidatus Saccharimonadales bacterium]